MPETPRPRRPISLIAVLAGAALLSAACAPADTTQAAPPVALEDQFITSVVDSVNDAGRAPSLTLDPTFNPVVSYLLLVPTLEAGELPAAVVPGIPQPPAIMAATAQAGVWRRSSVTPQGSNPVVGEAPEISDAEGKAKDGVNTGVAVDGQGTVHVVWTTPDGVFYSSGTDGAFTPREEVDAMGLGGSITADEAGTPWIAYFHGATLRVATRTGGAWSSEDVALVRACADCPPSRVVIGLRDGDPIVAYTDAGGGAPVAATGGSSGWSTQTIEDGGGGFGMSMAVAGDGTAHVAYYTAQGELRYATSGGSGAWEAQPVAGSAPAAANPARYSEWTTGTAVDGGGRVLLTYTDPAADQVVLTTVEGGASESERVPGSQGGRNPVVTVSDDGAVEVLAWFDSVNTNLDVSIRGGELPPIAFSPEPITSPSAVPPPTDGPPPCEPDGPEVEIAAQSIAFDTDCLAVPAGEPSTVAFTNNDAGIPHNVTIYEDASAATRLGGATGPTDTITEGTVTYEVEPLDAGVFYFRCDIHPTMQGAFVAA